EQEREERNGEQPEVRLDEAADRRAEVPEERRDREEAQPPRQSGGDGERDEVELGHAARNGDDLVRKRRQTGPGDDPRAPGVIEGPKVLELLQIAVEGEQGLPE